MNLNSEQKQRISDALFSAVKKSELFNLEENVELLVSEGVDRDEAKILIQSELSEIIRKREEASAKEIEENEEEAIMTYVSFFGASMIGVIKPIFGIQSLVWFIASIVLGALIGFFCHRKTPISGILATVCFVVIAGLAYDWYMQMLHESGRSSYRKIELLIPMIMAAVPSYLLLIFVNKILYSKKES